ncbi:hypothetical protein [Vibrio quintilis]|uniref:Uncharacterized protein n=1 Tax=Vibrio quintilis TaxID=1117707 RepID=A0A1M7YWX6_9VIBR|nr:hypothetical protein [Vibrio quintilis]SHO57013.1 hypothetical protein VQ7734_02782 [Vibrio quintilis]
MEIELMPLSPDESGLTFDIFKQYMKPIVDEALGWDEAFQRHGFTTSLQPEWFHWVIHHGHQAGLICR